jgi:hypothetical protein
VTKHIASGLAAKLSTVMLMLDVEKAFDCVWHDALLHKLLERRFSMVYMKLIWSFLGERSVDWGECHRVQFSLRHSTIYLLLIIFALTDIHVALLANDSALFSTC